MSPENPQVQRSCSRCGAPPSWLVTVPYSTSSPVGRLLLYCDRCRAETAAQLGTVLPLPMVDQDSATVLTMLYRSGATASAPDMVAQMMDIEAGDWAATASDVLDPD